MKRRIPVCLSILMVTIFALTVAHTTLAFDAEEKAVRKAAEQFYAALNSMFVGDIGPMKEVWSHADDVVYMGPVGGIRTGWDQVFADWEMQAAKKFGGVVRPVDMHITVGQELAIVHNLERGENTNIEGKREAISLRATNLFRKEEGKWKLIGHHTDILPYVKQ